MNIIFTAPDGVNQFLIKSDGHEYELFKKATAKKNKNGVTIKKDWIPLNKYSYTLPHAVYTAIDFGLKADDDTVTVEAEKARIALGKILRDKVDKIAEKIEVQ